MKTRLIAVTIALLSVLVSADQCDPPAAAPPSAVDRQRIDAAKQASREQTYCYECKNILDRRVLFGKPGLIGYVVFLNYSGQPIMYMTVNGKCTSSSKRLEDNYRRFRVEGDQGYHEELVPGAGEDGTYGASDSYVYCTGTDGRYVQWNGNYLYSDKPFDLTIQPLVIDASARVKGQ